MIGLYEVSVLFQHQLDLAIAEGAELDVVHDTTGQGALAEPGEVLDDVLGLESHANCRVETVGGEFVLVDVFWSAHWFTDRDQEVMSMSVDWTEGLKNVVDEIRDETVEDSLPRERCDHSEPPRAVCYRDPVSTPFPF